MNDLAPPLGDARIELQPERLEPRRRNSQAHVCVPAHFGDDDAVGVRLDQTLAHVAAGAFHGQHAGGRHRLSHVVAHFDDDPVNRHGARDCPRPAECREKNQSAFHLPFLLVDSPPRLVVMMMTPFDALEPYIAPAEAPLSTWISSMSFGLMASMLATVIPSTM